jgi:hypothetical protein
VGDEGLALSITSSGIAAVRFRRDAKTTQGGQTLPSPRILPDLTALIEAWPGIPAEKRRLILDIADIGV